MIRGGHAGSNGEGYHLMKGGRLLDTTAAALAAGVTPRTIRRWVRAGLLTNHGTPTRIQVALLDIPPNVP